MHKIKILGLFSLILLLFSRCSQINKAADLITNPSPKEKYQRDHDISDELFEIWEKQLELALQDSLNIQPPYMERGKFFPKAFQIYSYNIDLNPGEILSVTAETDSLRNLVFIELFKEKKGSSKPEFEKIESVDYGHKQLLYEPKEPGTFKLVLQPEIQANTPFHFQIKKRPAYMFPVSAGSNKAIQSFWGASRDGGRRSHEGIDIFAQRGTPVVAATDGRITFTGEKGLGGKQVWLRDDKRNQSLYYAHLDSIAPVSGRIRMGDTIGYVGNTGNARTTPPHLHFGIYKNFRGAIDPLGFVYQSTQLEAEGLFSDPLPEKLVIRSTKANLRNRPGTKDSRILNTLASRDTLIFQGKTREWYHVRRPDRKASFIHESLVAPL